MLTRSFHGAQLVGVMMKNPSAKIERHKTVAPVYRTALSSASVRLMVFNLTDQHSIQ